MQFACPAIFRRVIISLALSLPFNGPITTRFQPLLVVMCEANPSESQLSADGFGLLGAFKRAALDHPATIVFLLGGGFRRFFHPSYRRRGLGTRLRGIGMRWRLQQILVRLLV